MADVAAALRSWSTTAGNNNPQGSTSIGTGLDDNLREIQKVVRQYLAAHGSNMASAGTVDLSTADGFFITITGTTTITAFGTESSGAHYMLQFAAALTLTHNATSLILPGGANITTAAGDLAWVKSEGSGNWRVLNYVKAAGSAMGPFVDSSPVVKGSADATKLLRFEVDGFTTATTRVATPPDYDHRIMSQTKGADVASAATLNLDTATGDLVDVTGTTTITAITLSEGKRATVRFTGALTLTNGASLVLPSAANITTAAGDFAEFRGYAAGVVRCVAYERLTGLPLVLDTASNIGGGAGNVFSALSGRDFQFRTVVTAVGATDDGTNGVSNISIDTSGNTVRVIQHRFSTPPGISSLHPDSMIEMGDGSFKWLSDIRLGDRVRGEGGSAVVQGIWRTVLDGRALWCVNGVLCTPAHLFRLEDGRWAAPDPVAYRNTHAARRIVKTVDGVREFTNKLADPKTLPRIELGSRILHADGTFPSVTQLEWFASKGEDVRINTSQQVISLLLNNSKLFYADGYAVSTLA